MAGIHKVVVTGGSGKAGTSVIEELLEHGYEVVNVDLRPPAQPRTPTYHVDLCDLGQVYWALEGCEAVVHLAAIPWPGEHAPEVVFRNNAMSSFNLLQAAAVLGINKLVLAGSESSLGFPFSFRPITPLYLPIDEAHPLLAQDAYGIGKIVVEEVARGFTRRNPRMSVVSLRLSYIIPPDRYVPELRAAWHDTGHNAFNLWAYIDARDVALAFRLAIERAAPGFDTFYIAAPDTLMREPTLELMERHYPGIPQIAEGFGGRMSPLDCRHAREILGFVPQHTWETVVKSSDVTPG